MLLVFRGPNAVRHLKDEVIGGFTEQPVGDTISGTYGDFIRDPSGSVRYFEPAVIKCPDISIKKHKAGVFVYFFIQFGVKSRQVWIYLKASRILLVARKNQT